MDPRTHPPRSAIVVGALLALLAGCSGEGLISGDGGGATDDAGTGSDASDVVVNPLTIEPANPVLQVAGAEATLQFTAKLNGVPLSLASWSIDNLRLGYIDGEGVFHANGLVAGTATITAAFTGHEASTTVRVISNIERVQDGVTPEQKMLLENTVPTADAMFRWLYPYDGTVFPRGLPGPFMQLGGGAADAMRITAKVGDFSFKGFFAGTNPSSATLPTEIWDALTNSADGREAVAVEVTRLRGTSVVGPAAQQWRIAPGDLKGIIYYNTYRSALTNTGAVMRIRPGSDAEVLIGGCTVCHSVSAQGNVLAAGVQWADGNPTDSSTFDLLEDGTAPARRPEPEGRTFPFAGLVPDGSLLVSNGVPGGDSPVRGLEGDFPSRLYNSQTGAEVMAPSLTDQVKYAVTPAFSPDSKLLAFTWYERDNGKSLAFMDVNLGMAPPTFSAPIIAATVTEGIVGWPTIFADGKGIVYQEGDRFDTAGYGAVPSYAELRLADIGTSSVNKLAALNGWLAQDQTYLPHGADEENRRNYEPSVLPVPVGGYYWVLFTSRRAYGHTLAPDGTVPGTDNEWGLFSEGNETPSLRKKLWVAAIDLDYSGKVDPSHPAFYLPGQELMAGNMRAYTALEPCRQEGDECSSGADCCGGFCRRIEAAGEFGQVEYTCVPPPGTCSNVDEACETSADCCGYDLGETCINNRCAAPSIDIF